MAKKEKGGCLRKVFIAFVVLMVLGAIGSCGGGSTGGTTGTSKQISPAVSSSAAAGEFSPSSASEGNPESESSGESGEREASESGSAASDVAGATVAAAAGAAVASATAPAQDPADAAQEWLSQVKLTSTAKYLEYSKKSVDPAKYVALNDAEVKLGAGTDVASLPALEDVEVSADGKLDLSALGEKAVDFTLSAKAADGTTVTDTRTVKFQVRDTKKPSIKLFKKKPKIEVGDSYDPAGNVKAVSDKVDGALSLDQELAELAAQDDLDEDDLDYVAGKYYLDGMVETSRAGAYPVKVVAFDSHGNKASKEFTVAVIEPEPAAEEAPAAPVVATQTYILNTNTGKFHHPGCRAVNRMKDSNKQVVDDTRDNIIARGYEPCGICNP